MMNNERYGLITGSRCSSLVPKRSADVGQRSLAMTLANERFFGFRDQTDTWQTEHGNLCEAYAFEYYQKHFDQSLVKGRWIKNGDVGGSTDAETDTYGVDFKCPTSLAKWLSFIHEPLDSDYYNQAQCYMYLTGFDKWYICAFLMETNRMSDNGDVYPVPHDKRMISVLVERSQEWQDKFLANVPVVVQMRDEYLEILKSRFE